MAFSLFPSRPYCSSASELVCPSRHVACVCLSVMIDLWQSLSRTFVPPRPTERIQSKSWRTLTDKSAVYLLRWARFWRALMPKHCNWPASWANILGAIVHRRSRGVSSGASRRSCRQRPLLERGRFGKSITSLGMVRSSC